MNNGEYLRICGNENLYTDIIELLGHQAKQRNQRYEEELAVVINKFTAQSSNDFCRDGRIDWNEFVRFNSGNMKSN